MVPWVCFGTAESPVGLVCVNHQEPEPGETDSYVSWPYEKEADGSFQDMTVFGFGRKGCKESNQHTPDLKRLPARFSIGLRRRGGLQDGQGRLRGDPPDAGKLTTEVDWPIDASTLSRSLAVRSAFI